MLGPRTTRCQAWCPRSKTKDMRWKEKRGRGGGREGEEKGGRERWQVNGCEEIDSNQTIT